VGISATNRNFKGRMGSRDAKCYLASPEVVAASALAGYIRGPYEMNGPEPIHNFIEFAATTAAEKVEILPGFPERVHGRLVFLPQDNVNTDAIYGKDYTYRDDVTKELMAKVVMENYDPQFASRTNAGDVVVSGFNFGTGSSREQAVTCLKAKGIPLVIAGHTHGGQICLPGGIPLLTHDDLPKQMSSGSHQIDDTLLIVSRYRDELAEGSDREQALIRTMATSGLERPRCRRNTAAIHSFARMRRAARSTPAPFRTSSGA